MATQCSGGTPTSAAYADEAHGFRRVDLPAAVCTQGTDCFIGGAPRLLVEAGSPADRPGLVPAATPIPAPEREEGTEAQAMPTPTLTPVPPTPTGQPADTPSPGLSATSTATPTPLAVAQNLTPSPTPEPTPTPLPPITPLTILTPARCLILIVVGLVIFTITYGIQVALWWRRQLR